VPNTRGRQHAVSAHQRHDEHAAFSRYKTFEASMTSDSADNWSAQIGGSHTWAHDFPSAYPNNPNVAVR
jgi:hypothetical protein